MGAKIELEAAGLPQAEVVAKTVRHPDRDHRENSAGDRRGRPEFEIDLLVDGEGLISCQVKRLSGW